MKKKLLFVIPSLKGGGAEKSLVSLLSVLDYEKYDVDLLLFRKEGLFLNSVPPRVRTVGGTQNYEIFDGDAKKAVLYFLKKGKLVSAVDRVKYSKAFGEQDDYLREKMLWKYLQRQLPPLKEKYDCAIGYLEGNASFFACQKVKAEKVITYVHSDFKKIALNEKISREVFEKSDFVVTVSQRCLDSLCDVFPDLKEKFRVVENIVSPAVICPQGESEKVFEKNADETVLLTVGRLCREKGIDLSVRCCRELKNRGRKIKWYHLGAGELKEEIERLICSLDLKNDFILLGEKPNPYPYMAGCDIYVQPSRFEGKSIAIDEVKCFCRPMVVTDFTTVADQVTDGVDGLVCRMNEADMADKVERLLDDRRLYARLEQNLAAEQNDNSDEAEKLYALIES